MKAGALVELLQQVDPETEVLIRIGDLSDLERGALRPSQEGLPHSYRDMVRILWSAR